jgi:GMP synthase-like glutamine amidotransferase
MPRPEIGWHEVRLTPAGVDDPVLGPVGRCFTALEWHSYEVALPSRAIELAHGANCLQAYRIGSLVWGIQFHAEVTPEDFQHWLDHYTADADAVAEGIDPHAIAEETRDLIAGWNELGKGICERFLVVAKCARLLRAGAGH